jgi:thiamine kinase-like enzyme
LYGCAQDSEGDPVLLLEDLAPAQEGDLLQGCTLDQVEMLIAPLAELHASWWSNPELDRHAWLPAPDQQGTLDYADQISTRAWKMFRKKHGDKFPPSIHAIGEALQHDRSVLHRLAAPPLTLVHGDLRCNNLMFADSNRRDLVAVIDWQTVSKARGPFDIASLFVNNLEPEDRRIAEARLLPCYHQLLQRAGVRDYDYGDCWVDYRLAVINQFSQVIVLSALLDILTLMGEELSSATGTRLMVALLDLETADLLPKGGRRDWRTLLKGVAERLSLTRH